MRNRTREQRRLRRQERLWALAVGLFVGLCCLLTAEVVVLCMGC